MNKVLLTLSIMVLSRSLLAQESPTTPKAARVQIIQGPEIALASWFTVIRWTTNNPGGSPVHYGIVHYGTDPKDLSQTAKNPIRLNPYHSSTVFRVHLYNLKPGACPTCREPSLSAFPNHVRLNWHRPYHLVARQIFATSTDVKRFFLRVHTYWTGERF
jgi:hypothetical protein